MLFMYLCCCTGVLLFLPYFFGSGSHSKEERKTIKVYISQWLIYTENFQAPHQRPFL